MKYSLIPLYAILFVVGIGVGTWLSMARAVPTHSMRTEILPSTQPQFPRLPLSRLPTVTILVTGDVMLGRSVTTQMRKLNDFVWPFREVRELMENEDIVFINLETPIVEDCPSVDSGFKFCADTRSVEGLLSAGVDVASLANNHTLNYGPAGLESTTTLLQANGIQVTGIGTPEILERAGTRYAFLSFNDVGGGAGIDTADPQHVSQMIDMARSEADIVIAQFHWGNEYVATPSARQSEIAHHAIDSGADIVVGAHPHWVQSHEMYLDRPIYYSLGNFVFDQDWSEETQKGLAVRFTFQGTELISTEELPVRIYHNGQPAWDPAP